MGSRDQATAEAVIMGDKDTTTECPTCGKESRRESEEEANREVTHCEWCGAEYPVPEEK
jgi:transcription elongation factor Elf1